MACTAINPGPTDTGWMTEQQKAHMIDFTPLGRLGVPQDCAKLVTFLAGR
ncbi:3-ketoacyl-(acyl-carrier-protein) reductase [Rhodococcus opacus RKJ300 = JCM 13270]|uniref:3-ketoacyl-(Acyl-carrier-protein) reductase n=1 Tax=Rhodococcus opacus RKJ300 = JCM 13270 TaxID=1165867 RepID=I0WLZ8_RHOOP|nr:3-ketoacyl-(acyl-carrier-protein) reductase [Rhodococcus opacus RKJ300 = JCM 13270]